MWKVLRILSPGFLACDNV